MPTPFLLPRVQTYLLTILGVGRINLIVPILNSLWVSIKAISLLDSPCFRFILRAHARTDKKEQKRKKVIEILRNTLLLHWTAIYF